MAISSRKLVIHSLGIGLSKRLDSSKTACEIECYPSSNGPEPEPPEWESLEVARPMKIGGVVGGYQIPRSVNQPSVVFFGLQYAESHWRTSEFRAAVRPLVRFYNGLSHRHYFRSVSLSVMSVAENSPEIGRTLTF